MLTAIAMSLRFGAATIGFEDLLNLRWDILSTRAFRSLCAIAVGAALAVSGLLLQALTRNPLADPGITGINAGAGLGFLLLLFLVPQSSPLATLTAAALGAGLAGCLLYGLAGLDSGGIRLRLPLAGLAIQALCMALALALVLTDARLQTRFIHWLAGSVPSVRLHQDLALGTIAVALLASFWVLARLDLLSLGAERSQSLGQDPRLTAAATLLLVTILSGAAVTITGPLAFLGLIIPFFARRLAQGDLRHSYLLCLPGGAIVLLLADTLGRIVLRPAELEAGIIIALIGGPLLMVILHSILRNSESDGL